MVNSNFIRTLPLLYTTLIGDKGNKISSDGRSGAQPELYGGVQMFLLNVQVYALITNDNYPS